SLSHQGTFMEFYGFTPPAKVDQTFKYFQDLTFTEERYPEPSTGDLFYNTTTSAQTELQLQFDEPFLLFDYAVASVAELETLYDQTIIVDDSNTEIQWGGSWEEKRNYTLNVTLLGLDRYSPAGPFNVRPHGNGTHESDKVGDYLIFQFQGDSKIVHLFSPGGNFHLKLNFTLDGHSQLKVFTNDGEVSQLGGSPHFPYFRDDSLAEGNHTLIMTVDDVTGNTSVVIDYLTYKPSFATLKDKPTFPPVIFNDNSTSAPNPSQSPDSPPGPRSNTGIIAGSVGGVAFLGFLALGIWLLYRRKRQVRQFDQWGSTNTPAVSDLGQSCSKSTSSHFN
ncbi:hypothetical protein K435DRAFT_705147, partial [Dendrothele bispora CBS 962.96]